MPKLSKKYPHQFLMRTDDEFERILEEMRNLERPVPNRADYMRKLLYDAHRKAIRDGRVSEDTVVSLAKRRK